MAATRTVFFAIIATVLVITLFTIFNSRTESYLPGGYQHKALFFAANLISYTQSAVTAVRKTNEGQDDFRYFISSNRRNKIDKQTKFVESSRDHAMEDDDDSMNTVTSTAITTTVKAASSLFRNTSTVYACQVPRLKPWNKEIMPFLKNVTLFKNCSSFYPPPMTYLKDRKFVMINKTRAALHYSLDIVDSCYAIFFARGQDSDKKFIYSDALHIDPEKGLELPPLEQFIFVYCGEMKRDRPSTAPYYYHHLRLVLDGQLLRKIYSRSRNTPSVLLVMNDAVSYMNGLRQLPKTLDYLKFRGGVQLEGFHSVGANTFPNMIPYMTGMKHTDIPPFLNEKYIDDMNIPFLWNNFTKHNYITAYSEDKSYSTFNYEKKGFHNKPTDYYLRAYLLHLEKVRGRLRKADQPWHCYRERSSHEVMIEIMDDFLSLIDKSAPFFFWSFYNELSHAFLNEIGGTDNDYLNFFKRHYESGRLENTIVIFSGDHGQRFTAIRRAPAGRLEERLPLQMIVIPKTFRKEHKELYDVFLSNRKVLTTPYDMHETLLDVMDIPSQPRTHPRVNNIYPRGMSLFGEIPKTRTCRDAHVGDSLCVCRGNLKSLRKDMPIVQRLAQAIVDYINNRISVVPKKCWHSVLGQILSASQVIDIRKQSKSVQAQDFEEYIIAIETGPGAAWFEGSIRLDKEENKIEVLEPVFRINVYGRTADCVDDSDLKNYCYCKSNEVKRKYKKRYPPSRS